MRLIDADKLIKNKFKNDISYNAFVKLVQRQPTIECPVCECPVCTGRKSAERFDGKEQNDDDE